MILLIKCIYCRALKLENILGMKTIFGLKDLRFMYKLFFLLIFSFLFLGCSSKSWFDMFSFFHDVYQHHTIASSPSPHYLKVADSPIELPQNFKYMGIPVQTEMFLNLSGTGGLLVVKDNEIVFEKYYLGNDDQTEFTSWSVAKSFTSALIGIAISQGHISNVDDLASEYVPELLGTAYRDVSIKDLLQMSSGVAFEEEYSDLNSDVYGLLLALGKSLDAYIGSMTDKSHSPGTFNDYKGSDTQILGMVLSRATGQSLASYLETNLWKPLGAESDAHWSTDRYDVEATFCCIGAVLRDYAKFGLLYLNGGKWDSQQLLPSEWISASIDISEPHLQPGDNPQSSDTWGYGYQWWVPDESGDYMAIGVFNQFIYVNPEKNMVIVKNSANPLYLFWEAEDEHLSLFREISRVF